MSKNSISASPAVIALGRAVSIVIGLLTTLLIARSLGPSGRGETAAALSAFFLVPIVLGFGLPLVVRRHAARGYAGDVVRTTRALCLPILPAAAIVGALLVAWPLADLGESARVVSFVGVTLAPITVLWLADQSVLVAQNRYLGVATVQITMPAVFGAVCLGEAIAGELTVTAVLIANIVAACAALVVSSSLTRTPFRGGREPAGAVAKESVTYAGGQAAEAASNRLDQVFLLPLMGSAELGLYSIAATVALAPLALAYAITARSYSRIANADDGEQFEQQAAAARAALYWSISAAGVIVAIAWWFVPLVFGSEFEAAVVPCMLAAVGTIGVVTSQVCSNALAAVNRGLTMTLGQFVGLVVGIVLMILLAPPYGASGAAIASSTGYLVTMVWVVARLHLRLADVIPTRVRVGTALREMFVG
ncbi:MAG: lipopolysaccharide biosynthesis protein [Solirubrobacterales bacterium]